MVKHDLGLAKIPYKPMEVQRTFIPSGTRPITAKRPPTNFERLYARSPRTHKSSIENLPSFIKPVEQVAKMTGTDEQRSIRETDKQFLGVGDCLILNLTVKAAYQRLCQFSDK